MPRSVRTMAYKRRVGSETYVKGEKLALHEGFEPSATEFRSPCSAVELMEREESIYVGLMFESFFINVFFIMPITITQLGKMSTVFSKNLCLLAERLDNEGLFLLLPPR